MDPHTKVLCVSVVYNCLLGVVGTGCYFSYLETQSNKVKVRNVEHGCIFHSVLWLQVLVFQI